MESNLLLAEKNVYFHGIWKAEYRISDNLMKSIGNDITSKPSRLCTLRLTSAGLTLEFPASDDGKERRMNQVAFSSLRDISINKYQQTCLVIIFVDSNNKFSVMACSHQDDRDLEEISNAFRQHRNFLLKNVQTEPQSPPPANWTLLQKQKRPREGTTVFVRESYLRSSVTNGVAHSAAPNDVVMSTESFGASQRSTTNHGVTSMSMNEYNNDDEVFGVARAVVVHEPGDVERVAADGNIHGRPDAFHVSTMTSGYEEDFDVESITSALSQMSAKSDMPGATDDRSISPGVMSSGISSEQYFKLKDTHGNRTMEEVSLYLKTTSGGRHMESSSVGDDKDIVNEQHNGGVKQFVMNGINEAKLTRFDLRSLSTQTINSSTGGRRYAKKQMIRSSSNSYKEKADALRKRSSSTGQRSPTAVGTNPVVSSNVPHSAPRPAPHSTPRPSVISGVSQQGSSADTSSSHSVKRTMSIGSTTIIKPIESVYAGRSTRRVNSARNRRPINLIIYSPSSPKHAM